MNENKVGSCEECGSEFLKVSSKRKGLCPECSHILYDHPNNEHVFIKGTWFPCLCDGKQSTYIILEHNTIE